MGVYLKLNPMREVIADKRLVVVDDSVVRGTTTSKVVEMLRRAGAREVHMRICLPSHSASLLFRDRYGESMGAHRRPQIGGGDP